MTLLVTLAGSNSELGRQHTRIPQQPARGYRVAPDARLFGTWQAAGPDSGDFQIVISRFILAGQLLGSVRADAIFDVGISDEPAALADVIRRHDPAQLFTARVGAFVRRP